MTEVPDEHKSTWAERIITAFLSLLVLLFLVILVSAVFEQESRYARNKAAIFARYPNCDLVDFGNRIRFVCEDGQRAMYAICSFHGDTHRCLPSDTYPTGYSSH